MKRYQDNDLTRLADGIDVRAEGEHDNALKDIFKSFKEDRSQPRIEFRKNSLLYKDSNGAIITRTVNIGPETLENLESSYLAFQTAYEDFKTITKAKYLQWTEHLLAKGLEISDADKGEILAIREVANKLRAS